MSRDEEKLITKAKNVYKKIYPCGGKEDFKECFSKYNNKLFLWFDTEDNSTHLITEEMKYR